MAFKLTDQSKAENDPYAFFDLLSLLPGTGWYEDLNIKLQSLCMSNPHWEALSKSGNRLRKPPEGQKGPPTLARSPSQI